MKNVKSIQQRVSNTMNTLFSSKKNKSTRENKANPESDIPNNNTENGPLEYDSRINNCDASLFDGFLDKNNINPFHVGQAPNTGAAPGNFAATKTEAAGAPRASRQPHHTPSQPLTEEQSRNTITSEEMHRPKLAKKKTDFDEVVDTIVNGAKSLKRRVSMSMNVLFSSEREIQSLYGSMYGDSMAGEAAPVPLYGNDTSNESTPPIGDLPINKGWEPFQEDTLYDMLKTQATTNNNTDVKDNTAPVATKEVPPVDQKATAAVPQKKHDGARSPSPMNSGDVSPLSLGQFV
ncbi:hypothetical protein STCU_09957 [Strigomonas culicis]|uniref:Uncharacterized protein n=1 Tax=Strigomonas culicis TaxID=28005 RepID=S9TP38_9TRYP|nr:hypothetical protein STCU_09957 [Strigomonas culicis]|eukprot:EPY18464.1 hypothetical protein STCU_09957 [Strigomonas culicis]